MGTKENKMSREKPTSDYIPRLSINISLEQKKRLARILEWGVRRRVFSIIIEDFLTVAEDPERGPAFIGGILSRKIHIEDFVRVKK